MCRIAGICDFSKSLGSELEKITILIRDSMAHGGPDDAGIYIHHENGIALGHRRLSIIDTSALGHQPMSNREKNIWITYNGEIYNFLELRKELVGCGFEFKSKTDTEVLIYGYEQWGIEELLSRLRGMFAFAIYDKRNNASKLILARDRFGIKPLYYYKDKEKFIFASEVRALMKSNLVPDEKSQEAMVRFLQLGSVPAPLTTVKNVYSIPCGQYIEVNKNGLTLKEYWSVFNCFEKFNKSQDSYETALGNTSELLEESIKMHLISDVPLGVFLSGGIDSSAIVAIASKFKENKLKTLSVVFNEDKYNEASFAKAVAERYQTDHREILLTSNDFIKEVPNILNAMDEPSVDGVNTYFISKAAKEAGLTVVLSGIGGDEVFLGYKHYKYAVNLGDKLKALKYLPSPLRKTMLSTALSGLKLVTGKQLEKLSYLEEPDNLNQYMLFRGLFAKNEILNLTGLSERELNSYGSPFDLNYNFKNKNALKIFNLLDFYHYLQNQILKDADFMSMKHALEIRVPFLDHKLFEGIIPLSAGFKLNNNINKPLLVNAIKGGLPQEIVNRKKMGFTFPFDLWLKENHIKLMEQTLDKTTLNTGEIDKIWKRFLAGELHWSRVWAVIVVESFK